jgi:hypothetical protein
MRLTKEQENELMWESLIKESSPNDPLSILLDSKHMLEHMIKTINVLPIMYKDPNKKIPKVPNIDSVKTLRENVEKVYKTMDIDESDKPLI